MPENPHKLNVAAYVHYFGANAPKPKSSKRIAAGQVVDVDPSPSGFPGYRRVVVAADTLTQDGYQLAEGLDGYIRITKLTPVSGLLEDLLELQAPAMNGPPRSVPSAWQPDNHYHEELLHLAEVCQIVDSVLDLYQTKESRIDTLRTRIQGMSGLQIAAGAAGLGVAIAGTVVTFGALAPVFLAIGIGISASSGAASVSSSLASAEIDKIDKNVCYRPGKVVGKSAAKGAGAVTGKYGIEQGVSRGFGAAAEGVASSSLGIAGGAIGIASGAKGLYSAAKIDPSTVWKDVKWAPIYDAMGQDEDRIRKERPMADKALWGEFDRVIKLFVVVRAKLLPLAEAQRETVS